MARMDIVTPRHGSDGKTYFTKIGSAWETKSGGWSLSFDALPIASMNDQGKLETRALLMVPRDNTAARGNTPDRGGGNGRRAVDDLDDDVPFATNDPTAREPGVSRRVL